jgi:hypothetical protein
MNLRLKRFFVDGLPKDTKEEVLEGMLRHGIGSVTVIDRPELQRLEVVCFYNLKEPAG